jgi:dephospho-CoA kinase
MSLVLGVTGGIATGKSTVVKCFVKAGIPVIDADIVAREVVEPGMPGLKEIQKVFGSEMINADGTLARKKLGKIIFADEQKRGLLNRTLGPFIRKEILQQIEIARKTTDLVVVDIPLLYETGYESVLDQVAVVYIPESIQLERLMKRDQLTKEEAQQRIDSQLSIEEKRQRADIIFDNQGTIAELESQVQEWLANQERK